MHQYDKTVTAARQNGFDIDASAFEMGITAINYAYILFIGLAVLFAGIAFFSVLNTFSVTIAKRSHIMTNFILLGARKTTYTQYILSLIFIAAARRCNRIFADAPAVFLCFIPDKKPALF